MWDRQRDSFSSFLFLLAAENLNVMMNVYADVQLFPSYRMRLESNLNIILLHFAYDILLLGEKGWENIRTLNTILILFELTSA